MTTRRLMYGLACVIAFLPVASYAQLDLSSVTLRAGAIPSQTPNYFEPGYIWSFYPEVEVGGHLFAPYLNWGVTWGYWSDGIDQPKPWADFITYARTGHILSARMRFSPQALDAHIPLPITFSVGIAEHLIKTIYVGGTDFVGKRGANSIDQAVSGLLGIGFSIPVSTHLILEAQAVQYIPLGGQPIDRVQSNRRSWTLGVGYTFQGSI